MSHNLPNQPLNLDQAIDRHPAIVTPEMPMADVIALMSRHRSSSALDSSEVLSCASELAVNEVRASCALVMEGSQLVGLLTESDIVRFSARRMNLDGVKAAEVMNQSVVCLKKSQMHELFGLASIFREHKIRHLPILDDEGALVGLMTADSIRQLLQPRDLLKWQTVAQIMTTSVVTVAPTASVWEVVRFMVESDASCAVIVEQKNAPGARVSFERYPIGTIALGDILQFHALGLDLATLSAETAMSVPLFCLSAEDSLWTAHQQMQKWRTNRLVVCGAEGELLGIVTLSNLLRSLDPVEMYRVVQSLEREVRELEAEKVTILQNRDLELEKKVRDRTAQLLEQLESDRLLATMADRIRRSLNLEEILSTTVCLVREYLQSDRVLIYRFNPDSSAVVVAESVGEDWDSFLGKIIRDPCFDPDWVEAYTKGRIRALGDIYNDPNVSECHLELLGQLQSGLILPVFREDKLWGLMTAHYCGEHRQWQKSDIKLLDKLAGHLAIAIQQADLYEKMQAELYDRQKIEEILRDIVAGVCAETGEEFFRSLVRYLVRKLGVEYAMVGSLVGSRSDRFATRAFCAGGEIVPNFEYSLKDTPWETVFSNQETSVYYRDAREECSGDRFLEEMEVESYLAVPLLDRNEIPIGIILVLSRKALPQDHLAEEVLKIFAPRAVVELQRVRAQAAVLSINN